MRYRTKVIEKARVLRGQGKTYGEIRKHLGQEIPKSTLSEWCKNVVLPTNYQNEIAKLNLSNLSRARQVAIGIIQAKRKELFERITRINLPIAERISDQEVAKIALAMLCLGEASKYNPQKTTSFYLGSSDPRIVTLFLQLLRRCFNFDMGKVRCTVQCRADQDTGELELFWQKVTGVPARLFYKSLIDPRTKGKPTRKVGYKGVLKVDYFDRSVQHELESLADLVYNQVNSGPEV